jgi:phosphotransferase system IIA component
MQGHNSGIMRYLAGLTIHSVGMQNNLGVDILIHM